MGKTQLLLDVLSNKHRKSYYVEKLVHLHKGNSTKRQRDGKPYKTVAIVRDEQSGKVATGVSWCSKDDNPVRKVGHDKAIGRAVQKLVNGEGE